MPRRSNSQTETVAPTRVDTSQKLQAIKIAMEQIQKQYGQGSIMRLGETAAAQGPVDVIPTGSIALDLALGIGGLPRGRIIEIFGPEASGKCVSGDTLVFTDKGMLPIEAFGYLAIPGFQRREIFIHSEHSFEKTSHFYNDGLKKTIKLRTKRGFTLEGTPNHRIRVLDKDGNYLFRRLDEVGEDDFIAIQRNQQCFGVGVDPSGFEYRKNPQDHSSKSFKLPKKITKEWALLMGYLIGDGTCTSLNKNNISITVGDDEVGRDIQQVCLKLFGEQARVTRDKRNKVKNLRVHNVRARSFLAYAGVGWWKSSEKEIPWSIMCSPKKIVAAFLSALFECDGCFSGGTIEYATKSERLAEQLQVVLLNFGIVATVKIRINQKYGPFFYLYIEGQEDKRLFAKRVGFRSRRKQQLLLRNLAQQKIFKTNLDVIPNINVLVEGFIERFKQTRRPLNRVDWDLFYDYLPKPRGGGHSLTYDRLKRILKHFSDGRNISQYQTLEQFEELGFYWDKVAAIQPSVSHVVDFTVPKSATFFGNGFVNHNTTLGIHVIAEAQKQGGTAAFVDAEHALDPLRAEVIGVNVDDLLISQPDTGEQALEIVETLVRSGAVDVIVVDSVAALVPRAEIEGEMGDAIIGVQARLMSQALRKLTGAISKTRTCLIFTNQLRHKIGVMFGNPETTPGGLALKFYASVRIDVRKTESLKEGDTVVGSRHRARVVKNKVAPPFRVAEFNIMNDVGISKVGGLVDVGVELALIERSGAFYRYNNAILGQGKPAAISFLQDQANKKIVEELERKVRSTAASTKLPKEIGDHEAED